MPTATPTKDAAGHVEGYEIFIKYLPAETTAPELRKWFAEAGEIVGEARLMTHPQTGKCKGVGWLTFATEAGFTEALGWDGCEYGGRRLAISSATKQHTGFRPSVQAPGTHTPALLQEVLRAMVAPDPSGVYVDATFGRGGHTRGMLAALSPRGSMHAFDMDPDAIKVGKELAASDARFAIHHSPFSAMAAVLGARAVTPAAVFFDLGISSPQFDEAHRGFRPEADGPLDLRFDQSQGQPAWQFLQEVERGALIKLLCEYGETTDAAAARRIADTICLARQAGRLPRRTREFAAMVATAKGREYQAMHPAKLTFQVAAARSPSRPPPACLLQPQPLGPLATSLVRLQSALAPSPPLLPRPPPPPRPPPRRLRGPSQALRVHLNREFDEMRRGMRAAFELLGEGGRIGLITWKHSECAIVVDFFRSLEAVRPILARPRLNPRPTSPQPRPISPAPPP